MTSNGKVVVQHVVLAFDKSIFGRFDNPEQWNVFIQDLMSYELLPPMWEAGSRPPPLGVLLDLSGLKKTNRILDGIDLSMCSLDKADFSGSSLKNALLGCGRNVSYRGCRLDHADLTLVEISGCDFTDCSGLETALFDRAVYDPENPPVGLPLDVLAKCRPTVEPPTKSPVPSSPQEANGFTVATLKCTATIHRVPVEE